MNYLRTAILLAGLTGLFMAVGYLIGGGAGAVIALLIAAATNLFSYWNSDKLVLSMHQAQEVDERSALELVAIVRELAQKAGLPMPRVYLMDSPQPNAFATGRNPQHAAVCATTGLLNTLSRDEVAGVIGHELAHVRNHDTLTMTITATVAGAISMLAQFGMFFGGRRDNNSGLGIVGSVLMIKRLFSPPSGEYAITGKLYPFSAGCLHRPHARADRCRSRLLGGRGRAGLGCAQRQGYRDSRIRLSSTRYAERCGAFTHAYTARASDTRCDFPGTIRTKLASQGPQAHSWQ
jgi:hypothetical protein